MKTSDQRAEMEAEENRAALVAHLDSHLDFSQDFPNREKKKTQTDCFYWLMCKMVFGEQTVTPSGEKSHQFRQTKKNDFSSNPGLNSNKHSMLF